MAMLENSGHGTGSLDSPGKGCSAGSERRRSKDAPLVGFGMAGAHSGWGPQELKRLWSGRGPFQACGAVDWPREPPSWPKYPGRQARVC